ncbi:hypothetical protein RZ50_004740 [Kitasatospora sp. SUK 42]|nr:hypothetical protein [Kitasatospora sp. SUK 42]
MAGKLGEAVTGRAAGTRSANAGAGAVGDLAQAGSVTQALPGADKLAGAVPGAGAVADALPLGSVQRALPLGSVEESLPATDVLGLAEHGSANRLGGADLGQNNPLSGLLGGLGPLGGLLGGANGGSISGLPL